eukprot:8110806-Pyramimonas_sp.AAC.1
MREDGEESGGGGEGGGGGGGARRKAEDEDEEAESLQPRRMQLARKAADEYKKICDKAKAIVDLSKMNGNYNKNQGDIMKIESALTAAALVQEDPFMTIWINMDNKMAEELAEGKE